MATQSRLLTGTLTGSRGGVIAVTRHPRNGRSGKPPFGTLDAEAERLAKVGRNAQTESSG